MTYTSYARQAGVVALVLAPTIVAAQAQPIAIGTQVRIEMHDKSRIEGTLMAQSAESLSVASPRGVHTGISSEYIARVRRGDGKSHAQGAVNGLKIGAGIGGGMATLIFGGAILAGGDVSTGALGSVAGYVFGGVFGGALYGVIIGAIVGAEKWTTVYTTPQRVSLVPAPGTAPGIGIRVGF